MRQHAARRPCPHSWRCLVEGRATSSDRCFSGRSFVVKKSRSHDGEPDVVGERGCGMPVGGVCAQEYILPEKATHFSHRMVLALHGYGAGATS